MNQKTQAALFPDVDTEPTPEPTPANSYQAGRQAKAERFRQLAEKNKAASDRTWSNARASADIIPLGQPILVGHHSEGPHRRHLARIQAGYAKAVELEDKAKYYQRKADNAESDRVISSDDPEAVTKLREKLAKAEESGASMRAFNKCMRKKDNAGMLAIVGSQGMVDELIKPDFAGRPGFADYQMSNNNGNISTMKKRLARLEAQRQQQTTTTEVKGMTVTDNVEDNRLQLFFPGKPSDEVRRLLKSRGFRWSPMSGAWQRHRSNGANYEAQYITEKINKGEIS